MPGTRGQSETSFVGLLLHGLAFYKLSWALGPLDASFLIIGPLSWTESFLNLTRSLCPRKDISQSGHLEGLLMLRLGRLSLRQGWSCSGPGVHWPGKGLFTFLLCSQVKSLPQVSELQDPPSTLFSDIAAGLS